MQDEDRCIVKKKADTYLSYVPLFSWASHQESWSNCVKIPILTLRYEDLQNETFLTFKKVILFIKEITKYKISFDRDKAKKSINSCEFNKLQKLEEEKGFAESVINEKTKKKVKFFNLGNKNNYKELLNAELLKNMNNLYDKQLKKYGYEQ